MRKNLSLALLLGGLLSGPCVAWAESPAALAPTETSNAVVAAAPARTASAPLTLDAAADPVGSKITGSFTMTYQTAYISRGIILEDQGAIVQPYLQLNAALADKAGPFTNVFVYGGLWSSLHSHHEFAGNPAMADWYEFDYIAGIDATLEKFTFDLSYQVFTSPSDSFGTAKNVQAKVSFDDTDYFKAFALHPYALAFFETDGKAGTGKDLGVYIELGIAPGMKLNETSNYPVSLSFPITLGLGLSDFYGNASGDNETFGYASFGVAASVPLAFIPSGYGAWSYSVAGYYYYMGDGVRPANDAAATDSRSAFLFNTGISISF